MKFLDLDSPLMQGLNKLGDLLWLNLLTLFTSIPIITAGASFTAMHHVALKIARNEEGYITRDFFKSFKVNFRQATIIWMMMMLILLVLAGDFYIINYSGLEFGFMFRSVLLAIFFLVLFIGVLVFPVLARFENTVFKTIKNSLMIGVLQLPKTILMIVFFAVPAVLFVYVPQIIPLVFLFGLSLPAWASAKLYSKFFRKLEERFSGAGDMDRTAEEADGDGDERIFRDESDPALQEKSSAE